jgi:hypothetical protein
MIGGDEIKVEAGGVTFLLHLGANIDHLVTELAVKTSALYKAIMRYIGDWYISRNWLLSFPLIFNICTWVKISSARDPHPPNT